jgi:hypothetical protein
MNSVRRVLCVEFAHNKAPVELKKSKTEADLEYEQRRTDFMLRLGENTEPNKIIPINTANVWSVIKIVHNRELNERHIVLPRSKLVCNFVI